MCAPIGLIAGIASAGASFIGQRQAASAQERAQANATQLEQQRFLDQANSARVQQAQANIASAQRIRSASLQAEQARARATVAAGEAGVTGLSVNALVDDMTRREAQFRFYENQRQDMSDTNLALSMEDARMRSRMNLLGINQPIQQPNLLGSLMTGLQVGTAVQSVAKNWGSGNTPTGTDLGVSGGLSARPGGGGGAAVTQPMTPTFTNVTPALPINSSIPAEFFGPPDLRGSISPIPFVGPPDLRGLSNSTRGFIDPSLLPPL